MGLPSRGGQSMPDPDGPADPAPDPVLRRLAGGFGFSWTPMLMVDSREEVEDVNAALRELTGDDLAGSVGAGLDVVSGRLQRRSSGSPLPPGLPGRPRPVSDAWRPGYDQAQV